MKLTFGFLLVLTAGVICYSVAIKPSPLVRRLLLSALVTTIMTLGIYLTRIPPYFLALGLAALALSFVRGIENEIAGAIRLTGMNTALAAALAIFAGLFPNPFTGDIFTENRKERELPDVEALTPEEVLSLKWSTHDTYADWPVASLMLTLSDIAYDPPSEAKERVAELGFDCEAIEGGSMQGYVIDAGDDSIIAFRGTEKNAHDILQDLVFIRSRSEQGSIHGGFERGYRPMHNQVDTLLRQFKTKRVWITGHSLGGGLAVVCAYRLLAENEYPIAGVMTFGQPKVVTENLAELLAPQLNGKYVFFVNDMDPVTRLVNPYFHFGHMVRWTDSEIKRSEPNQLYGSEDSVPAQSVLGIEEGYISPMNEDELDEMIESLESTEEQQFDEGGNPIYQGYFPNVHDHYLSSYRLMLNKLQTDN